MHRREAIKWLVWPALAAAAGCARDDADVELVHVASDATRELFRELNPAFARHARATTGLGVRVTQSHGGSGAQARAVLDGLRADVVSLALAGDVETLVAAGLVAPDWSSRWPDGSCPYTSTIVFLIRRDNPKGITDWPDLARPDVRVLTPNPKTSGAARWAFLAAWASVTLGAGGDEAAARAFVARLYANVPKLDSGARAATETFLRRRQGDVLLAWENEALLARRESVDVPVDVVYPGLSVRAEPPVAVVDRVADERGTRALAEAYLRFLYSAEARGLLLRHGYRPAGGGLPPGARDVRLVTIGDVAGDWAAARRRFFADGGVFDQIYAGPRRR
jgi:sulfate transport system substrate-binding protein